MKRNGIFLKILPCRLHAPALAAALFLLPPAFLGCGGGDGSVTEAADNVISQPGAGDPETAGFPAEFLGAVNAARSSARSCGGASVGPSPPVAWSDRLATAARLHSEDMARNGFLGHTGSDGSSAGERIERQGYSWRAYGENVAVGQPTVPAVIAGWLASEGHCRNLMNAAFTGIGAGTAVGRYGGMPEARYWTVDLAAD